MAATALLRRSYPRHATRIATTTTITVIRPTIPINPKGKSFPWQTNPNPATTSAPAAHHAMTVAATNPPPKKSASSPKWPISSTKSSFSLAKAASAKAPSRSISPSVWPWRAAALASSTSISTARASRPCALSEILPERWRFDLHLRDKGRAGRGLEVHRQSQALLHPRQCG